ncbi:WD40 repeat domain-containing protein [Streptomyces sp. NPDC058579]|uniref:WD40 repeat domain-containing protein n=1 Tax=Streptomyces sp. NPDC058579 TaxID=3346548 RepID=UPI0036689B8B
MTGSVRGDRPAAGTEAEAAALLGWLTAPDAPRLCLVVGGPRRGKSALLGWLATHGTRAGARRRRAARELIPLAGQCALGAAWTVANRLGVVARTPGELVQAVATTEARRAALVLPDLHAAAEPEAIAELIAELAASGRVRLVVETCKGTPSYDLLTATARVMVVDLDDDSEDAAGRGESGRGSGAGPGLGQGLGSGSASGQVPGAAGKGAGSGPGAGKGAREAAGKGSAARSGKGSAEGSGASKGSGSGSGSDLGSGSGSALSDAAEAAWDSDGDWGPGWAAGAEPYEVRHAVDLADPVAVCTADPLRVTTAYVTGPGDDRGGLRSAWLRTGQSLCREQHPADRAVVLLGALGDGADPRLLPALRALAAEAPWRVRWTRVRGDLTPPWPGPVTALGAADDRLLVAGTTDAVQVLGAADATTGGEPLRSPSGGRIKTLAPAPDGTLLLLDERGRLLPVPGPEPRPPYLERLTTAVAATLTRHPGTALAAIGGSVVVGDRLGSVHAFGLTGIHQAALHSGRVTAVTAVETEKGPFLCSGGQDGTVRRWIPGRDPDPAPIAERRVPVVSLHATETPEGTLLAIAWADGLVELRDLETRARLTFRPGPPVRAVAVTPDGAVAVGMDEALLCLERVPGWVRPRRRGPTAG